MSYEVKWLGVEDYDEYHRIRLEGFRMQPRDFRYSEQDEKKLSKADILERLKSDFIIGAYREGKLIGIGGLADFIGSKLNHKMLLWGMYVRSQDRRKGIASRIMRALINHAVSIKIERILLTVISDNIRAINFYKKWDFIPYAVEPNAVKLGEQRYLDEILMARSL